MIAVIDYGMGNLRSVEKACEYVGLSAKITSDPKDIRAADRLILPGVGAFGDAMRELGGRGLTEIIKDEIAQGKPFLGICLGFQVLFESSQEAPGIPGLGIFEGSVDLFNVSLKVPHMGWNQVCFKKESPLIRNIDSDSYFYFVHSFFVNPANPDVILGTTSYETEFVSMIQKKNIVAIQFHPEKSQEKGLEFLRNFGAWEA